MKQSQKYCRTLNAPLSNGATSDARIMPTGYLKAFADMEDLGRCIMRDDFKKFAKNISCVFWLPLMLYRNASSHEDATPIFSILIYSMNN